MSLESRFLQEVTLSICESLDLHEVLRNFYNTLQKTIPVKNMLMSHMNIKNREIEIVAFVDEHKVDIPFKVLPLSQNQLKIISSNYSMVKSPVIGKESQLFNNFNHAPVYQHIVDKSSLQAQFFQDIGVNEIEFPAVFIRFENKLEIIGSVLISYEANFNLSDEHEADFKMLGNSLRIAFNNCLQYRELTLLKTMLAKENKELKNKNDSGVNIIGANGALQKLVNSCKQIALSQSPVYIHGETGTGKEVFARFIHAESARHDKPFVVINCAAISPTLIDSELFGYEKGAFTGAFASYKGRIERANGGTLFLDELAELPKDIQSRFLRVLESHEVERIGGNKSIKVDFRLISATHQDITELVQKGEFREDLFYRLHVIPITIPPLRERKMDIPQLVRHFINETAIDYNIIPPPIALGELEKLLEYDWPGNVREVKNMVELAMTFTPKGPLVFDLKNILSHTETPIDQNIGDIETFEELCRNYFIKLIKKSKGKLYGKNGAAQMANLNYHTLRSKLEKLNINFKKYK